MVFSRGHHFPIATNPVVFVLFRFRAPVSGGGSGTAAATARSGTGVGKSSFQFVGVITQFKESLSLLMDSIGATQVLPSAAFLTRGHTFLIVGYVVRVVRSPISCGASSPIWSSGRTSS